MLKEASNFFERSPDMPMTFNLRLQYRFGIKMETEAAVRSRRRRTQEYVEESDAATTTVSA